VRTFSRTPINVGRAFERSFRSEINAIANFALSAAKKTLAVGQISGL
jgi:hypothetical protein